MLFSAALWAEVVHGLGDGADRSSVFMTGNLERGSDEQETQELSK